MRRVRLDASARSARRARRPCVDRRRARAPPRGQRDRERGQTSLFGLFDAAPAASQKWNAPSAGDYIEAAPWDRNEMLSRERQSLGFYVSGHPLERYLKGGSALARLEALPASTCNDQQDWAVVKLAGMVEGYRERVFRTADVQQARVLRARRSQRPRPSQSARKSNRQLRARAHVGRARLVTGKVSFPRRDEDEPEDAERTARAHDPLERRGPLVDAVRAETRGMPIRLHDRIAPPRRPERCGSLAREGDCPIALYLGPSEGRRGHALSAASIASSRRSRSSGARAHLRKAGRGAPLTRPVPTWRSGRCGPKMPSGGGVSR